MIVRMEALEGGDGDASLLFDQCPTRNRDRLEIDTNPYREKSRGSIHFVLMESLGELGEREKREGLTRKIQ